MGVRYLAVGAAAALATLLLASTASATIMSITYKGMVYAGQDDTGEYGLAGQSLIGQAFTSTFLVDLDAPGALHDADVWYDFFHGDGAASPVKGTITINGVTQAFGESSGYDNRADHSLQPGCLSDCTDANFVQGAITEGTKFEGGIYYSNHHFLSGGGFASDGSVSGIAHGPVNYTNPPTYLGGFMEIDDTATDYGNNNAKTTLHHAIAYLSVESVTTGAVPEPTSWALMIGGFGMAGAALRRRRMLAGNA